MYDRSEWPHWVDEDGDCQDTRAEILIATSQVPVKFKRNKGCVVTWGEWYDPYTGKTFTKASDLDIDHIVPLKEAHRSGGYAWSRDKRREFANDPENLIPVDLSANRAKSDQDPAGWMPENEAFRCEYVLRWIGLKTAYQLETNPEESQTVQDYLDTCKVTP